MAQYMIFYAKVAAIFLNDRKHVLIAFTIDAGGDATNKINCPGLHATVSAPWP